MRSWLKLLVFRVLFFVWLLVLLVLLLLLLVRILFSLCIFVCFTRLDFVCSRNTFISIWMVETSAYSVYVANQAASQPNRAQTAGSVAAH